MLNATWSQQSPPDTPFLRRHALGLLIQEPVLMTLLPRFQWMKLVSPPWGCLSPKYSMTSISAPAVRGVPGRETWGWNQKLLCCR